MTTLNPYLSFRDEARSALEFYHSVLGGELTISTFGELQASDDPAEKDRVMHGRIVTPGGLTLMASDTPGYMELERGVNAFSVSLSGDDADELRGFWEGLSAGARIDQPLVDAPWGDTFGMLTDRFGVAWLVNITATA